MDDATILGLYPAGNAVLVPYAQYEVLGLELHGHPGGLPGPLTLYQEHGVKRGGPVPLGDFGPLRQVREGVWRAELEVAGDPPRFLPPLRAGVLGIPFDGIWFADLLVRFSAPEFSADRCLAPVSPSISSATRGEWQRFEDLGREPRWRLQFMRTDARAIWTPHGWCAEPPNPPRRTVVGFELAAEPGDRPLVVNGIAFAGDINLLYAPVRVAPGAQRVIGGLRMPRPWPVGQPLHLVFGGPHPPKKGAIRVLYTVDNQGGTDVSDSS